MIPMIGRLVYWLLNLLTYALGVFITVFYGLYVLTVSVYSNRWSSHFNQQSLFAPYARCALGLLTLYNPLLYSTLSWHAQLAAYGWSLALTILWTVLLLSTLYVVHIHQSNTTTSTNFLQQTFDCTVDIVTFTTNFVHQKSGLHYYGVSTLWIFFARCNIFWQPFNCLWRDLLVYVSSFRYCFEHKEILDTCIKSLVLGFCANL